MGHWELQIGNINVLFKTKAALGMKFTSGKEMAEGKVYVPAITGEKKEIEKFDADKKQKDFYDTRYTNGVPKKDEDYLRKVDVEEKHFDPETPTVFISEDKMNSMYPLTKKAKVISKQPITKLELTNISASKGYYLLPEREYENIVKYKKAIDYIGDDFVVTSPMRLQVGAVVTHNYAIFRDSRQHCLIAVEILVKEGMQEKPQLL